MVYTKTVTLSGAALSSFLAAGGQTVNPDDTAAATTATTSAVAQVPFPTVADTATATATMAQASTTVTAQPQYVTLSSSSSPSQTPTPTSSTSILSTSTSSTSSSASSSKVVVSSAAISAITSSLTKSSSTLSRATVSTHALVTSSARAASSSAKSGAIALASSTKKASSKSSGISGAGIAGLVIGLLVAFGMAGLFLFLWQKRKKDKKAAARAREERNNEKGAVSMEAKEINTPTESQGFDFGNLAPLSTNTRASPNNNVRSASPAQMQRGAAVLGIQRPYTPPPGHPAHPNYRQPPVIAAGRQMQQQVRQPREITPNAGLVQPLPRKPVPTQNPRAPVPQRSLSSNNPFSDQVPPQVSLAPALAHSTAPEIASSNLHSPDARRTSVESFIAGDDSFEAETLNTTPEHDSMDALSPRTIAPAQFESQAPVRGDLSPSAAAETVSAASGHDGQPGRSKSIIATTDNWAARKEQLKNNLALRSNPTSPAVDQSPFADPAPMLDHEITSLSPMNLEFPRHE